MKTFGKIFGAALTLFLFLEGAGSLYAGPMMLRPGEGPGKHPHSRGFRGKGICPQPRVTAEAPEDRYHLKNPLEPTNKHIEAGKAVYRVDAQPTACKICHGITGNGFGMMALGLNPAPRNFTCSETMQEIPDGQLFWIIQNGSPGTGMPAYRELTEKQIWQIILYLRTFSR